MSNVSKNRQHYFAGEFLLNNKKYFVEGRMDGMSESYVNYKVCLEVQKLLNTKQFIKLEFSKCNTCNSSKYSHYMSTFLYEELPDYKVKVVGYSEYGRYSDRHKVKMSNEIIDRKDLDFLNDDEEDDDW